jgi:hypothetical protein
MQSTYVCWPKVALGGDDNKTYFKWNIVFSDMLLKEKLGQVTLHRIFTLLSVALF